MSLIEEKWPWIDGSNGMRTQVLDLLNNDDLAFNPGGENVSLGALLREMGEVEYSYTQSLKTFKQDWTYRNPEAGLDSDVAKIKAWYQGLDEELKATISALSDEDAKKTIDRGGYAMPVAMQIDVYLQALLIFFGKLSIYFKMMEKAVPQIFQEYIG